VPAEEGTHYLEGSTGWKGRTVNHCTAGVGEGSEGEKMGEERGKTWRNLAMVGAEQSCALEPRKETASRMTSSYDALRKEAARGKADLQLITALPMHCSRVRLKPSQRLIRKR